MTLLLQIITTVIFVTLFHFVYKLLLRKWRNEPPGPWGVPILGYSPFLKPRAFKAFMDIKAKYPDIAEVDFGQQPMILLNSYETIKEALLMKGDNFAGRQEDFLSKNMGVGGGIVSSEGAVWKEHRRFALRTLRDFGLGRNGSEKIIQTEVHQLIQLLEREVLHGNGHIDVMDYLLRSVSNVICTLTMGEQPGYENDEALTMIHKLREVLEQNFFTFLPMMFPGLFRLLTPFFMFIPRTQDILKKFSEVLSYLQGKIDEHEKEFDISQERRDYIEAFLIEKVKQERSPVSTGKMFYTSNELQRIMLDLFLAGTDTTSNSLSWGFLLLAVHPDIQLKCHEEIDSTIGPDRQPTMKDKEQMPYIQAVLDEVQRYATIVPTGIVHRNYQADTIQGYHIPAGSLTVPFLYGAHHDPRVWERPEEFYPEHFLFNVDGNMRYKPREELIPFLIGKRECLGESLAKMELFLFFVSILQKFEVRLPSSLEEKLEETLLGTEGPIHSPGKHQLLFRSRH